MTFTHQARLTRKISRQVRAHADGPWFAAAVLIVAACSVYAAFWPGLVDWDSSQIIAGALHGPVLSWWTGLGTLLLREWLSLNLSIGLLWAAMVAANVLGFYGCLRLRFGRSVAAATTLLLTLTPPIYAQLASFSRDNAYVGLTLLGFAALGHMTRVVGRARYRWLAAGVACALVASVMRQNGIVNLSASVVFLGLQGRSSRWRRTVALFLIAGIAAVACWVAINVLQSAAGVEGTYASRATLVYDLAAMSVETGHSQFPAHRLAALGPGTAAPASTSVAWLRAHFNPWDESSLTGVALMDVNNLALDAREHSILQNAWVASVLSHPFDYLLVRLRLSSKMLGLDGAGTFRGGELPVYAGLDTRSDNWGYPLAFPGIYRAANGWLRLFVGPTAVVPLDRGWVWLLVLAGGTSVLWVRRSPLRAVMAYMTLAAGLNQAVLLFTAPSASPRYVLILPAAGLLTLANVVASHQPRRAAESSPELDRWRVAGIQVKPALALADRRRAN